MSSKDGAKYPDRIRIGFADYTLEFVPAGLRDQADGMCQRAKQTIKITDDLGAQYRAFVVLHEVMHGCFFSSALSESIEHDHEEMIVDALSKQLIGVIRDNPELMASLAADLNGEKG